MQPWQDCAYNPSAFPWPYPVPWQALYTSQANSAAKIDLKSAAVVSHQTYVDILRHNPHWHCIILEGGIDENNSFHYLPTKDTSKLTGVFRQRMIKYFVDKGLLENSFARNLLFCKHSSSSVGNSVKIPTTSKNERINLSQYYHTVLWAVLQQN